jgi:signal transduction histidine kinase
MQSKDYLPETPSQPHASLLLDQREANEQLLLAALRAQEDAEEAHSGRIAAEGESDVLRVKAAELLATGELRERLLGIIGHDLRNPLNAMLMAAQLLEEAVLPAQATWLANRILTSGLRMQRMIDQLADFTRTRLGGGFELKLVACDLAEICKNVVEELALSSTAQIKLTTTGALLGKWDSDRLAEVLSNLIGNATGHASLGTAVLVDAYAHDCWVIVQVRNQGAEIRAEDQERIFSAFRRADSRAGGESEHLGLGLYISRELALAHGGTLEVASSSASTTFSLRLPRLWS